ncbi:hypothetical protein ACFWGN_10320 [Oerskovia sp. NPDC060338]|uniref:hypothetical protein n=1 Tax=Oerskovia sp. NPDC060338 TaxID=3347100 RepID=UPI00364DCD27
MATEVDETSVSTVDRKQKTNHRRDVYWCVAVVVTVVVAGVLPTLFAPRYYFNDDTQIGAFGIWFRIGELLREQQLPIINPRTWMAGNYFVEGQWGLLNPMILMIGAFARATSDAVVFSSVVKIVFLAVAGLGAYGLARNYGAHRHWAYIAGTGFPLAGFTFYMDATTWVTGLFTSALIPWFWWMARRTVRGANPIGAFVAGYLVITVGYVHGTIALVFVVAVTLLDAWLARRLKGGLVLLATSVLLGLVALAVYLPGVLTASVTVREGTSILNDGFFVADLNGLLASAVSTARPEVSAWWGAFALVPMLYVSWALPLIAFVDFRRVGPSLRRLVGLGVFLLVMILWVMGPSYVGPLRIPVRMMPYVALALLVGLAVLLSRAPLRRPGISRLLIFAGLVAVGLYVAFAQVPDSMAQLAAAGALLFVTGVVFYLVLRRGQAGPRAAAMVGVVAMLATFANVLVQHHYQPAPPLQDFGLFAKTADYRPQLAAAEGDVFVVGSPTAGPLPQIWDETLLANQWYLNASSVQNVYTPIGYASYATTMCMNNRGETCSASLDSLLSTPAGMDRPLVDLMGISSIQLIKSAFEGELPPLPADWSVVDDQELTQLWVRDVPVASAGGVTWTTPGLTISDVEVEDDRVSFTVDEVPEDGADVVFSRLAWPGYSASGAEIAEPAASFLLTASVAPGAQGQLVEIEFRPPGWTFEVAAFGVGVLGSLVLSLVLRVKRPRDPSAVDRARRPATSD